MKSLLFYISIFLIVFLLNLFGSKLYQSKNKILSKLIIFIGFIILLLLIGLRYEVGTDYNSYLYYYNIISVLNFNELYMVDFDIGAKVVFKLCSMIFTNEHLVFMVLGLLTLYPIYKANKLYDYIYLPYSVLSFCFLFLPFSLNGMRQGIAISFMLLAFVYLFKNKKINSLIAIMIAIAFHKTSVMLIPYMALYMLFKGKKYMTYSLFASIMVAIAILFFGDRLLSFAFVNEYSFYLEDLSISSISYKIIYLYLPILIVMLLFNNRDEKNIYELRSLVITGIIFDVIGSSKQYLYRISLYYTFFIILLIPILSKYIKNDTIKKMIYIFYILYLIIYFIYEFYTLGKHEIFPYQAWI